MDCLHFLLGDVDIQIESELQRDDGAACRTGRGHLLQAGHLAELALERRGDGGCHDVGAGAGIERDDLDGRVIDLGQRRKPAVACRRPRRRGSNPAISSEVATGRRINGLEGLTNRYPLEPGPDPGLEPGPPCGR